jgi:hypothetical protein
VEIKIKDFLIYYLKYRLIIFPIHEYYPFLADNIVKQFYAWGLLENSRITQKEKYFKYFLEKEIDSIINFIKIVFKSLNVRILIVYKEKPLNEKYNTWFEDTFKFSQSVKSVVKKKTKYFKEIKNDNLLFINYKGKFKGFKCGDPTGEEIEFLEKIIDKKDYTNN